MGRAPERSASPVAAGGPADDADLLGRLLLKTSRTFALSIPVLPEPTCREVTVAYLLFRIADTLEDATQWSQARQVQELARHHQSRFALDDALGSARKAVERSPKFAFAWARLAELEFGFGRLDRANEALEQSLELAPRNAAAVSLQGFLLAGRNRIPEDFR